MRKIREILRLKKELSLPHRSIARAVHVAVGTVSEYLAKVAEKGLNWPLPEELSDSELEAWLFPRASSPRERERPDFAMISSRINQRGGCHVGTVLPQARYR